LVRKPTPAKVEQKRQREKIGERPDLVLIEEVIRRKNRESEKPSTNFGNFCQKTWPCSHFLRLSFAGPVNGVTEDDEIQSSRFAWTDEHREFSSGVRV